MMPLEGIRVLDLSRLAPRPYCTMLLGDLGADVIVVEEPPGVGRRVRTEMSERAAAFNALGRNKRSIELNLKDTAARDVFHKLSQTADVVLEGFRPGVVKRLDVDYETLSKLNARPVYCSLSGYGQDGPTATWWGTTSTTSASAAPPAIPMNLIADFAAGGMYAAFAIVTALLARNKTGRGQYIDMAMTDGVISLLATAVGEHLSSGHVRRPGQELLNEGTPTYCVYETADGRWLSIDCLEPWFWQNLCQALGCQQFITYQNEPEKFPEIFAFLREKFKTKTRDEWFEELRWHDICLGPVYSLDEVVADPHVQGTRDDRRAGAP